MRSFSLGLMLLCSLAVSANGALRRGSHAEASATANCPNGQCANRAVQPVQQVVQPQFAPQQFAPQQFAPQQFAPQQFVQQPYAQSYGQQFVQQQFQPEVAFVPAQVAYGQQVVMYDPAAITGSGLGYSYQETDRDTLQSLETKVDKILRAIGLDEAQAQAQALKADVDESEKAKPEKISPELYEKLKDLGTIKSKAENTDRPITPPQDKQAPEQPIVGWKAVLKHSCVKCHGPDSQSGLSLVNDEGQLLAKLPRLKIYNRAALPVSDEHHMPKGGPALPPDQLEALRLWAREGLVDLDY